MTNQPPITMKDIARELGCSIATVSRALSNSPRISAEKRERIQQYARQHNFYPNVIGEALRHSRVQPMKVIGVIMPELVHYYFSTILSGIEEEASRRGYRLMVAQSHEQYEKEVAICDAFYKNKACGIIVSQAKDTKQYDHFRRLMDNGVPLVFYDRISTGINCSRVVVDDYMGAFNAVTHLIETGCRRIAFFGSPMNMEISKNRLNGYKDALLKAHIKVDDTLIYICDNRQTAEALMPEILQQEQTPDGYFAVNDDTAIGILYAVKRHGLRVPEDVEICGFTNGERAIACDPMLTTVEQRGHKVGEEAVDILIKQVEGTIPKTEAVKRIVRTKLIVRGTTRSIEILKN